MQLRDFELGDLDAVLRLDLEAFEPELIRLFGTSHPPDLYSIPEAYQLDGAFLIGLVNDEVVATGGVMRSQGGVFELRRMRVAIAHQRHGYGRLMARALEERVLALGGTAIKLDTTIQQIAAQRFYESEGYVETARGQLTNERGKFDVVYYKKELV